MKKTSLLVLLFIGVVSLLWWNYFGHDKIKAKQEAEAYYTALMNQDYENAFEHLYVYDEHTDVGTTLSTTEAKEIYLEKTKYLQQAGYKIKEFQIECHVSSFCDYPWSKAAPRMLWVKEGITAA